MAVKAQSLTGVAGLTSDTFYPMPPIEWGRAGRPVATITQVAAGSGYSNDAVTGGATTSSSSGTGLTLTGQPSGGAWPASPTVAAGGDGYRIGDLITVTGGGGDATYNVTTVTTTYDED